MQIRISYCAIIFLVLLTACKKEKHQLTRKEMLMGSTWSLYSQHVKLSDRSTKEVIIESDNIGNCSMTSRLQFLSNNIFRYEDICSYSAQGEGTWSLIDNKLTAVIKVTKDRSSGYTDTYLGIPGLEIVRMDESSFEVVRLQNYESINASGTTKILEETTAVYKRVD